MRVVVDEGVVQRMRVRVKRRRVVAERDEE
jgi:hypothetical protein